MSDQRATQVTASVVSHGHGPVLQELIRMLSSVRPASLTRLIVTLNISEPPPEFVDSPFDVIILRNPRPLGFGANHNQAFRYCETQWFAVLNPDLRFDVDPLGPLLAQAAARDAVLAPKILDLDGHPADATRRLITPLALMHRALGDRRSTVTSEGEWLAGMFLLIRSAAFREVGGFDERFFMYCEDADLSLRLRLGGWDLRQVADVNVVHAAQRASHRSAEHARWHVASLLRHWASAAFWNYLRVRSRLPRVH